MGNFNDAMLEKLADKGNGNYAYIDSAKEARKVLVEELEGTLMTIARDVKVQVEFNPAQVAGYRLIGYENRVMAARDFNDDTKDAGEVGAGHSVTALYELIPVDGGEEAASVAIDSDELESDAEAAIGAATVRERSTPDDADESSQIDPLRYASDSQSGPHVADGSTSSSFADELMTVKLRYKEPDGDASKLLTVPANDTGATLDQTSDDFRFAVAVAAFGMHLRGSASLGGFALEQIHELAAMAIGEDARGLRAEFLDLVDRAKAVPQSGR